MDEPVHTEFMNEAMLRLWERLGALSGDLRLYGGTALALYRNHRESTDFDFATPRAVVDPQWVRGLPWLRDAVIEGGPGMVDAKVRDGVSQDVLTVTFMECGHMIPLPTRDPLTAANGVAVAHPVDLVAAKVEACPPRSATSARMFWKKSEGAQRSAGWPAWAVMLATGISLITGVALGTALGYGGFAAALALMAVFSAAMVAVRRRRNAAGGGPCCLERGA